MLHFDSTKYRNWTDDMFLDLVKEQRSTYNEEALSYFLFEKYSPKLHSVYSQLFPNYDWYEDCVMDLFSYIKGDGKNWKVLRSFERRSKFGTWYGKIAYNKFLSLKPTLIGKDAPEDTTLPKKKEEGAETVDKYMDRIMVMEAIGQLSDADDKFIVIKTLQGYKGKEVANMLEQRWAKYGIVKHDNKGNIVTPSAKYINVRMDRIREQLKELLKEIK